MDIAKEEIRNDINVICARFGVRTSRVSQTVKLQNLFNGVDVYYLPAFVKIIGKANA